MAVPRMGALIMCLSKDCYEDMIFQGQQIQLMKDKGLSTDSTSMELLITYFSTNKENSTLQEFLKKIV